MSYTVLARRYRSRSFDEIVGQQPIVRTLKNAVENNRTAHAYLFCGTRGVGKTSMARIMAKALNATDDLKEKQAVGDAIMRGDDLDVIEIDAASNRGVQEARDLIAGAGLMPTRSPYKIYIIDEVHMLTREAFNALLKTMEEPPSHVKFILCTTEPHKVPATIQSRCQRFDFRPLSLVEIAGQLKSILKEEKVKASDDVIRQVARLGNGSMRDALSLLDRLLATGEDPLTLTTIEQMLGLPDQQLMSQLVDAFIAGDAGEALNLGNELLLRGSTEEQVLEMLAQHFRNLLVLVACGAESELSDFSADAKESAATQAEQFDAPGLVHLIALCDNTARSAKGSASARALFDAVIVRLALAEKFADAAAVLSGAPAPTPRETITKTTRKTSSSGGASGGAGASKKKVEQPAHGEIDVDAEETDDRPAVIETQSPHVVSPPQRSVHDESTANGTQLSPAPTESAQSESGPALWQAVLNSNLRPGDRRKVEYLEFHSMSARTIVLSIAAEGVETARYIVAQAAAIEDIIHRETNRRLKVQIIMPQRDAQQVAIETSAAASVKDDPLVAEAINLFDAVVTGVKKL